MPSMAGSGSTVVLMRISGAWMSSVSAASLVRFLGMGMKVGVGVTAGSKVTMEAVGPLDE